MEKIDSSKAAINLFRQAKLCLAYSEKIDKKSLIFY